MKSFRSAFTSGTGCRSKAPKRSGSKTSATSLHLTHFNQGTSARARRVARVCACASRPASVGRVETAPSRRPRHRHRTAPHSHTSMGSAAQSASAVAYRLSDGTGVRTRTSTMSMSMYARTASTPRTAVATPLARGKGELGLVELRPYAPYGITKPISRERSHAHRLTLTVSVDGTRRTSCMHEHFATRGQLRDVRLLLLDSLVEPIQ
jgi:hypothetical protein